MHKFTLFVLALLFSLSLTAQTPSSCDIPEELQDAYDQDVKSLAIKRMQTFNSPDFNKIEIPQIWQDSIFEGLAAIYNANSIPQRDSIFNMYCVHDVFGSPISFGFLVGVTAGSPMATAWEAGITLTGNTYLDSILTKYNFEVTGYISGIHVGILQTDQILNLYALGNDLAANIPEIQYGEPDFLIGGAGRINYEVDQNGNRLYGFRFEWNDCFDGCDNAYIWNYRVKSDCSVEFLGIEQFGFFGIEALPDPVNCMLTDVEDPIEEQEKISIFPNPTSDIIVVKNAPANAQWRLFSTNGALSQTGQLDQMEIDLSHLPKGMYFLQLLSAKGELISSTKLIKQ